MKRMVALLLCFVLLFAALPGTADAARITREEALVQEIQRIYTRCLELSGKESFHGFCGLLTSMQLWQMGINTSLFATHNGRQQYDIYAAMGKTSGGYHVEAYPATDYTLEKALNIITRNGTVDAQNILIGFESTNTEAGSEYGHACVIHAILDGRVYYVENFSTPYGGPEGTVNSCTIGEFARYYEGWTVLDGVIHFGNETYADHCQSFETDIFIRTRFASTLRSEPCLLTENSCTRLRSLMAGELLHATAVMKNDRGEFYYCVEDGNRVGYVTANAVSVFALNEEALKADGIELPAAIQPGDKVTLTGKVSAYCSDVSALRVQVLDSDAQPVLEGQLEVSGGRTQLQLLQEQLDFTQLPQGSYTVHVYATAASVVVRGTGLVTQQVEQLVYSQSLAVGDVPQGRQVTEAAEETPKNGWFYENGTWYYYRFQKPCTGWITYLGVEYYLNADGSVTTGWAEVEGWNRYFSDTGAMCIGWLDVPEGIRYWLPDGTEALGLQQIDGKLYYFDDNGLLVNVGTVTVDGVTYELQRDGTAVEVVESTESETTAAPA